ncbi:hypothetical protein CKM354_001011400 [Cercospora kikuchii]|uniref:Protein fem-1 homolog B n=1 Tax=Cercospora kikuchii TaxID=84275 RepID=A0A9P3FJJ4_9PEZI|nr:uncharacterized protein CKM354_001011400 [Cercospora kikuchii]GIZ47012.1 hypothetical protein CKM354_001011400 [Cercospora kikuchii]
MGLPQRPEEPRSSETPSTTTKASSLPPEALALATQLFDHARTGQTATLSQYITHGIPVNLTNDKGDSLLMLAAYHGHLETVQMLVEKGANIDALNDRGQSIVAGAVFKGYDDVVKYLAEKDADLANGQPCAIDTARMFKKEELLRFFGIEE